MEEENIEIWRLDGFIPLSDRFMDIELEKPRDGLYGFMQFEDSAIKSWIAWRLLSLAMRLGKFEVYVGRQSHD